MHFQIVLWLTIVLHSVVLAKPAEINQYDVTYKMQEIMRAHAVYKSMSPVLVKRSLDNFINLLDPYKTYFLEGEISKWLQPKQELLEQITKDFEYSKFPQYEEIFALMQPCIDRRNRFEERLKKETLPKGVHAKEFKDLKWCTTEDELYTRLLRMRALQMLAAEKMDEEFKNLALQRLQKIRLKYEEDILTKDKKLKSQLFCTYLLKAMASSLDAHTMYFTPAEASQFLVSVQQRLSGIGVQLRDDVDGFTVTNIIEGGPADLGKELKTKDKIIAIDHEPVLGLDGLEVVEKIRGKDDSQVVLTVLREVKVGDEKKIETKDITVKRGEVIIKEARVQSSVEPFGDGVIALLSLHSFYQDIESSSSQDLSLAYQAIAKDNKVRGVILDLRMNAGGLLTQAVDVVGLFIKKGIVSSIKDENGNVQHIRDIDSNRIWDGPLMVLVDRLSASAAEIVAQALQDYGRAIVIGDDHTYGKGSFQTFTLTTQGNGAVNPHGEYKVTRGRYYTVSGKTPQLVGVQSDIVIPGELSFMEVGEEYAKYPLENDSIGPNFDDSLSDVPFFQRERIRRLYQFDMQAPITKFKAPLEQLKRNSAQRISNNKLFQNFLENVKNLDNGLTEPQVQVDFQMQEAVNVMKDFIWLIQVETPSVEKATEPEKAAA
ncbi:MAG: PDZ domain-containing protein [Chlamydiales bacterium]|nr:PDZ domain-containing protein [Chlamydiales bacterium]